MRWPQKRDLKRGLEIKYLNTQLRVTRLFFLSLLSRIFDDQLSSNFHRFVDLCICCWDTPSEKTGLWQLLKVYSVFNLKPHRLKFSKLALSYKTFNCVEAQQMFLSTDLNRLILNYKTQDCRTCPVKSYWPDTKIAGFGPVVQC